jgi:hypothetical protein
MSDLIPRVGPRLAHDHMRAGALLVCAYDSDEKFEQNHLDGAISLSEFHSRDKSLSKEQEIIFYCA